MFGTLRLLLAIAVAVSHIVGNPGNLWIGVTAVVIFYIISGYAMTALLQSRFSTLDAAPIFYLERFIRLAPQYYFWLVLAMITTFYLGFAKVEIDDFIPYGLFAYLTVVPLGLQRYIGPVTTQLLPQATTLGIEITFYIISPLLLSSRKVQWGVAMGAVVIFGLTVLELLPGNVYTYYTSPGPIIYYLLGSFIYKKDLKSLIIFTGLIVAVLLVKPLQNFNLECLVGVAIGVPTVMLMSSIKSGKVDSALGNLSYGCFLGHLTVYAIMLHYAGADYATSPMWLRTAGVAMSVMAGCLSYYLVEQPTIPFRKTLKRNIVPVPTEA